MITQIYVFQKPLASMDATVFRRKSPHLKLKIIEMFGYFEVKNDVWCVLLGNEVIVTSVAQISSLNLTLLSFHYDMILNYDITNLVRFTLELVQGS